MHPAILFGKYRMIDLLGTGGNCEVYLAEHIKLNSFRAIKFISKNHPLYDFLWKEALILKNLKHSCIPIIYDIEENEEGSYIVEQYIEGETLKSCVNEKGPFREETILHFGLQLCDLIGYLHCTGRPILYIDLKPDNIILSGNTLKLIDFGSALYQDELSGQTGYLGTRGYAAPELYQSGRIDERCDVYGIGMLLYYMATGRDSRNNSDINHIDYIGKCSKNLKKVINSCLKFNPSQRYSSVAGLSRELSAMTKKSRRIVRSSQTVKIAVAGAQPRIGVTHLSFRLCKYYLGRGNPCVYQEINHSGCVNLIRNCYEEVKVRDGIPIVEGIPMLSVGQMNMLNSCESGCRIMDFGQLTAENLPDYLNADVRLLLLGGKDWELGNAEQVLQLTAEYKDIIYLFNYLDGRQFQPILNSMEHKLCLRIPYEPDCFAAADTGGDADFFQSLLRMDRSMLL
jgi:serine/threonine-protein kinase